MRVFVYMCGRVGAWVIISVSMHACVCVYVWTRGCVGDH